MILETEIKKQGNSTVIILPKKLGFRPKDKVTVSIMPKKITRIKDIAGLWKEELRNVNTEKMLKEIKKELWGGY